MVEGQRVLHPAPASFFREACLVPVVFRREGLGEGSFLSPVPYFFCPKMKSTHRKSHFKKFLQWLWSNRFILGPHLWTKWKCRFGTKSVVQHELEQSIWVQE